MGRSPCCEKEHTNKGAWTKEEDQPLVDYIRLHGEGLLRCGKSCRLWWINYLRPDLKRWNFTQEEDALIIKLHRMLGNKWSPIARRLPGRTDNEISNYWNTHIKRKLIGRGIDPVTHHLLCSSRAISSASVAAPQPPPVVEIPKLESAIKDNYCSSGSGTTIEEYQKPYEIQQQSDYDIDLELSIGLAPSKAWKKSKLSNKSSDTVASDPPYDGMDRNCQGSVGGFFWLLQTIRFIIVLLFIL